MANKKLTELPAISTVSSTTIFLVDDTGTTQTANGTVVKNYITSTNMVLTGNLTPATGNTYTLGSPTKKWADIYVGPNSIHLQDTANSQLDATMTITNGVLLINGANQLQVGQLKFVNNTIESTTGSTDIQIGLTSSSANLVLNRNVTLASGKTFTSIGRITATSNTGGTATNGVISINADGTGILPQNPGVMLNITGQGSNPARVYIDGVGTNNYAAIVGRHYNGNSTTPTQLLNNDVISRFAATPYATGGWPAISTTRMDMIADENQTATNQGSRIEFWVTPKGANTVQKQMLIDTNGATVTGDLTVTGTVNITGNLNPITYGIFGNTANITASANTATPILFDTSIANLGVTKGTGSSNSRIIVNKAGSYNIKAQLGIYQDGAGSVTVSTWIKKNGSDVAYSQNSMIVKNNPTSVLFTNDVIVPSLVANDYIEVYWALVGSSPDVGHVKLLAQAAQTTPFAMPASPSAIVTIIPV